MPMDELRTLIARHAGRGTTTTAIPGVLLSRVEGADPPEESTTGTILAIVAQGSKRLAVGGSVHDYGAGQYLVASVDLPVSGQFTDASADHPALGFGLSLRPEVVAELMLGTAAAGFARPHRGAASPPAITVGRASPELLDAAVRMLRLLDRPRDIPVLAPMVERELHWLLMTGENGATVRQLGLADSGLNRVRHAVAWIRDRFDQPIRVDELAQLTRMSLSTFHRNFLAVTAMSPIQYQKLLRLQEARIRLLASPGDVTTVAYAVGYESASQFSREYRRQFGAPPSRDAAELRAALAGAAGLSRAPS
ncbi:MAG: AraC family transcriptional regulator [Propionicimonas sp.]|nr:AraC family transcriptional regulator [Propionicimonas sp.]